ncbi:MAG TPA: Virginiamycin B lyase [Gammaproteobacteria bacterium]|nr:Virginiamycin B lyase [Gammaproteobacteria bacterium]
MMEIARGGEQRWIGPDERLTADGTVVSFPLPRPNSGPTTIALAPDGTVWFTLATANAIGRMDPDGGGLVEFSLPHPNSSPRVIALGADGNLWFSEHAGNRIGRIAPEGRVDEFEIPTPSSQPRAIALGADGNIWFGEFAGGKIGRITPAGEITEFAIPTENSGPRALAAGPDGNIWFSEYKASRIGRVTPDGRVTEFELPRRNAGPGDVTAGADGNLWLVELFGAMDGLEPDGNRVARVTPDGDVTELEIEAGGPSPINIAVGPDRNLWFTKGGSLYRVTRDGGMTAYPVPGGARTVGLSAGSDRAPPARLCNRLWFADGAGNRIGYLRFVPER